METSAVSLARLNTVKNRFFSYFFIILATIAFVPQHQLLAPTQAKTSAKSTVVTYIKLPADKQLPKAEHVLALTTQPAKTLDTANTAALTKIFQASLKKLTDLNSRSEATVKFKCEDSQEFVVQINFERTTDAASKKQVLKKTVTVYGYANTEPNEISAILDAALASTDSSVSWSKIAAGVAGTVVVAGVITTVLSGSGKTTPLKPGGGSGSRRGNTGSGSGHSAPNQLEGFEISFQTRSPGLWKPYKITNLFRADVLVISVKRSSATAEKLTGLALELDTYLKAVNQFNNVTKNQDPLKTLIAEIESLEKSKAAGTEDSQKLREKKNERRETINNFHAKLNCPVKVQYKMTKDNNPDRTNCDESQWLDAKILSDLGMLEWGFTLQPGKANVTVRLLNENTGEIKESSTHTILVKGS